MRKAKLEVLSLTKPCLFFYDNGDSRYGVLRVTWSILGVRVRFGLYKEDIDLTFRDWRLYCRLATVS